MRGNHCKQTQSDKKRFIMKLTSKLSRKKNRILYKFFVYGE